MSSYKGYSCRVVAISHNLKVMCHNCGKVYRRGTLAVTVQILSNVPAFAGVPRTCGECYENFSDYRITHSEIDAQILCKAMDLRIGRRGFGGIKLLTAIPQLGTTEQLTVGMIEVAK